MTAGQHHGLTHLYTYMQVCTHFPSLLQRSSMPRWWIPCGAAGSFILVIGLVYCELRAVQRAVKTAGDRFYFSLFIYFFPLDLSEKTVNAFTATQKSVMTLDTVRATNRKHKKNQCILRRNILSIQGLIQ